MDEDTNGLYPNTLNFFRLL